MGGGPGKSFRNERLGDSGAKVGKRRSWQRAEAHSHGCNRAGITLQKTIENTVPQCFDAPRGYAYDEVSKGDSQRS